MLRWLRRYEKWQLIISLWCYSMFVIFIMTVLLLLFTRSHHVLYGYYSACRLPAWLLAECISTWMAEKMRCSAHNIYTIIVDRYSKVFMRLNDGIVTIAAYIQMLICAMAWIDCEKKRLINWKRVYKLQNKSMRIFETARKCVSHTSIQSNLLGSFTCVKHWTLFFTVYQTTA